jgi:amidophosphoribosyltransferase
MSDQIKHECGIALIRLRKPLEYYQIKYGTWMYGLRKLYLLMEKQHNRGQDGAGFVSLKINHSKGHKYFKRFRSNKETPIKDVFDKVNLRINEVEQINKNLINDVSWVKDNIDFAGELFLGHLRYGTFGNNSIDYVHPVMRENNWKSRNLVLAGNFNLTNVDELYKSLLELGQHPKDYSDTTTMLENIGHHLDETNQQLFEEYKKQGYSNIEISDLIATNINVTEILKESSKHWDGGYVIGGLIGHGDAFVMRDPNGIRPAFYYYDDEVVVAASERAVIQTVFKLETDQVKELTPGGALIVKADGSVAEKEVRKTKEVKACSFERIYFSRGSDADIYRERKNLGYYLTGKVLEAVDYDLDNTVFSYVPNTAEVAFYGLIKGVEDYVKTEKKKKLLENKDIITEELINDIMDIKPRVEKIAIKDAKLRTFISQDEGRNDLVAHVYDITYNSIKAYRDNIVIVDDSIVRGTTLKQSILRILDRLHPKTIVVVSSAPQIRYPDCYGIDMARLDNLVAFRAAIELLKEHGKGDIISKVYNLCKEQDGLPKEEVVNHVKMIYEPFTDEEISDKIAELLKPEDIEADVKIVYQTVENLHKAIPNHKGDWYFTGDYPTPGGNKVVNKAYLNFIERRKVRAY